MERLEERRLLSTVFHVNTAADVTHDTATTDGVGSLRDAIMAVNGGLYDEVDFDSAFTIDLTQALPNIQKSVTIDGWVGSQRVFLSRVAANSAFSGLVIDAPNSVVEGLVISGFSGYGSYGISVTANGDYAQIQGNLIGTDVTGSSPVPNNTGGILVDGATGVTIGGTTAAQRNIISGNNGDGIDLNNAQDATVLGNYVGTDINGQVGTGNVHLLGSNVYGIGNAGNGIHIVGGSGNMIGGAAPNVISGNAGDGVRFGQPAGVGPALAASGSTVQGNYIGTDASGSISLPNGGDGVSMYHLSSSNSVLDNVVAGDGLNGNGVAILTSAGASGNLIQGNYIGTNRSGANGLGNGIQGIMVSVAGATIRANVICNNYMGGIDTAGNTLIQGNWIGVMPDGTAMGNADDGVRIRGDGNSVTGNTIAYNSYGTDYGNGVSVVSGVNNSIRGNAIYSNQLLGIDLGGDGVTGNNTVGHAGPNLYQNFPVITGAVGSMVYGTLQAAAGTYWVDLYASAVQDPSGYGEGQTYLGAVQVTTDGSGTGAFQMRVTNIPAGESWITATATDASGNTSEFSQAVQLVTATTTTTLVSSMPDGSTYGQIVTFTAHVGAQNLLAGTPVGFVAFEDPQSMQTLATIALNDSGDAAFTVGDFGAGTHRIVASYLGSAGFDPSASSPLDQMVAKADASIVVAGYSGTYDGFAHGATGTATGVNGEDLSGLLNLGTSFTNVPGGTANWSFLGDANYNPASGAVAIAITKANAVIVVTPYSVTYDHNMHTAAGTVTGVLGESLGGLDLSGTVHSSAGVFSDGWTFTDSTGNYNDASGTISDNIARRAASVTPDSASKVQGTADPILAGTLSGFIAQDNVSAAYSRTPGETPGVYTISATLSPASALGNYDITYNTATFTIAAAASPFSISGRILRDVTGNGLSADDTALAGQTVQLYLDRNANGKLDAADGAAVASAASGADGAYSFSLTGPGRYFVQEVAPSGSVRTAPATSSYYSINAVAGGAFANNDFDNFFLLNFAQNIANVSYSIDGARPVKDLRGHVHQGDRVQMTFTVLSGRQAWVSLVSYIAPEGAFNAKNAGAQQIYQVAGNRIFNAGTYTIQVDVPNGYFQVDAICGAPIDQFGPDGSNIFYAAQNRLLSADNGGTHGVAGSPKLTSIVLSSNSVLF